MVTQSFKERHTTWCVIDTLPLFGRLTLTYYMLTPPFVSFSLDHIYVQYAYRVVEHLEGNDILKHDNDDDGEDAAGSRLAHLLEMRNETNALVVVSRWFGGIHLGPKRFAHITNVARELLAQCEQTS